MKRIIGSNIGSISRVDSTNNYAAAQLLTKSLSEGFVVVATSQNVGRGQGQNQWESEPGKNLTFSIVLYPEFLEIRKQFELSKIISLGVLDFLLSLGIKASVKWPNDIYLGDKKVAGILIENSIRGSKISSAIVGIGLNVNQQIFISNAPNPVSLSQYTGLVYPLEEALNQLCGFLDARYQQLIQKDYGSIDNDYLANLYRCGIWSDYSDQEGDFKGRIMGVDAIGQLEIEKRNGEIVKYQFKEVVFK
jgi:BirA family transcriptional regulator, biotin operon repressor / biotin---[acetyl-CoA-carboxylase] ligase